MTCANNDNLTVTHPHRRVLLTTYLIAALRSPLSAANIKLGIISTFFSPLFCLLFICTLQNAENKRCSTVHWTRHSAERQTLYLSEDRIQIIKMYNFHVKYNLLIFGNSKVAGSRAFLFYFIHNSHLPIPDTCSCWCSLLLFHDLYPTP